jgi:hypothetical protein
MAHGFFTVEEWKSAESGSEGSWVEVLQLDAYQSLTKAVAELERRGKPGLFRVTQTQRCLWAEKESGKVKAHGCHVSTSGSLAKLVDLFEREGGRRPVEKARAERAKAKKKRKPKG